MQISANLLNGLESDELDSPAMVHYILQGTMFPSMGTDVQSLAGVFERALGSETPFAKLDSFFGSPKERGSYFVPVLIKARRVYAAEKHKMRS
ncbi:MAG: hypothetical protein HF982_07900 [Desulfobacteraceae bacterium]|nr:hypothetical protein [Desulfobacteraceae bacterium]MBC2719493.1 hypothetical protein [Desulfobacteraceae bacterium]